MEEVAVSMRTTLLVAWVITVATIVFSSSDVYVELETS